MTTKPAAQAAPTGSPAARFAELRKRHPRFVYERFTIGRVGRALRAQFRFRLEPEIEFAPEIIFEQVEWARVEEMPRATLETYFFHLGLVEMLSYWKAACSPEIVVRAVVLSPDGRRAVSIVETISVADPLYGADELAEKLKRSGGDVLLAEARKA